MQIKNSQIKDIFEKKKDNTQGPTELAVIRLGLSESAQFQTDWRWNEKHLKARYVISISESNEEIYDLKLTRATRI